MCEHEWFKNHIFCALDVCAAQKTTGLVHDLKSYYNAQRDRLEEYTFLFSNISDSRIGMRSKEKSARLLRLNGSKSKYTHRNR